MKVQVVLAQTLDITVALPEITVALPEPPRALESSRPIHAEPGFPPMRKIVPHAAPKATAERQVAYAALGLGAAALATTGAFGALALKERNVVREQCPNHACKGNAGLDAARAGSRDEVIADVALIAGALTLSVGAFLMWHSTRGSLAVSAGPTSASLSFQGTIP